MDVGPLAVCLSQLKMYPMSHEGCEVGPSWIRLVRNVPQMLWHLGVSANVMRSCPWWLIGVCTSLL